MHLEKEVSVVKITGNIKKSIQKASKVALLDGTRMASSPCFGFAIQELPSDLG